jgi:hypothetical protein
VDVFLESLDKMIALEKLRMCYAHFGDAPDSHTMLKRFLAPIMRCKEIVQGELSGSSHNSTHARTFLDAKGG